MHNEKDKNLNGSAAPFDAIVIGAGHAGIESGLALSRMGCRTLMLSITLDNIGYLACNPSIGGTAKGHLVREIDALGGQMGLSADKTLTQMRMLNSSKGPAVRSLRAQVNKYKYHDYMKKLLENQSNLILRQGEVKSVETHEGKFTSVTTVLGETYSAQVCVICAGVYLDSTIIVGDVIEKKGPVCFARSNYLADSLKSLGIEMRRFKTGTPARVHADSINLGALEVQKGERTPYTFSELSKKVNYSKNVCFLGYTNENVHKVIRDNLHLSPKYSGLIHGTGARYCPSIEDKIVRFADKERHQFFLEPEGEGTKEMYVQGLSTGLPAKVQKEIYSEIEGFEQVHIMRDAYAIEYECINPLQLFPTLCLKSIKGLYFAGQVNGTSGYEEAAAQGLIAGINAARYVKGLHPFILERSSSYIGVLIDDLVTVGTNEPYRMMTGRAEYRLTLRQDNADLRLTEDGFMAGLAGKRRYNLLQKKRAEMEKAKAKLGDSVAFEEIKKYFEEIGESLPAGNMKVEDIVRRNGVTADNYMKHLSTFEGFKPSVVNEIFVSVKYSGYIEREKRAAAEKRRVENSPLPADVDYLKVEGLRGEAREKLNAIRPLTIGQASRISGVTAADVNVLIIRFKSKNIFERNKT